MISMNLKRILIQSGVVAGISLNVTLPLVADTVARVGGDEVELGELREMLPELGETQRAALSQNPEGLNQLVRTLLIRQMVLEEAIATNWDQNPQALAAIEEARKAAIVESYLEKVSEVPEGFPSESQLKAFYESSRASLTAPKQYKLAQIFVSAEKVGGMERAAERARQIYDVASKDLSKFGAYAKKYSDEETTAEKEGEIGFLTLDSLQPTLRPLVENLEVGAMTEPVELSEGYHLVKLLEVQDAYTLPFEDVREQLAVRMRENRANVNRRAYLERLARENPVAINELVLSKLLGEEEQ